MLIIWKEDRRRKGGGGDAAVARLSENKSSFKHGGLSLPGIVFA